MALHRRVYLIGMLAALLTAALAVVALIIISSANSQASSLVQKNKQLGSLTNAQRNVLASQTQFTDALKYPTGTDKRRTIFVQAAAQQQLGLSQWRQFKRLAGPRITASAMAATLDSDLTKLPYVKSSPGAAPTATVTTPAMIAEPSLQVGTDFNAVRLAEYRWWSAQIAAHDDAVHRGVVWLILAGSLALPGVIVLLGSLARAARRRDADLAERDRDLARVARSNEFEARLQRALELSPNEDRVYGVVAQALEEMVPDLSVEMLLADSSRAHFQQLVTTGSEPTQHCSVDSPTACPAAQRGEVMTFESSKALDACPYLKLQSSPCSAICVPVSVSGLTVGVVHAAGEHNAAPDMPQRTALELISRRASDRIGMMRAFSDSEVQASTDPLTGLSNRRALESSMRQLQRTVDSYTVAFGDLDHFKMVNDKYGHGAGDHALRVFSRVLRDQLRPDDIFGRYGGEEFLIVLPHCDASEAVQVLERVRVALAVTLVSADCPSFTVSFGVAVHEQGQPFEKTISTADEALLQAKREGRDRVVVARGELMEFSVSEDDAASVMAD